MAEWEYFEEMNAVKESTFHFVPDDGIKGHKAVVANVPVRYEEGLGHMLLFYPLNNFEAVVKKNDFVAWNIVALIDENGTLLLASGTGNSWKEGDNLYDVLRAGNEDAVKKMKTRITNRVSSVSTVKMGDTESALTYVPVGINNWTLVTGISQDYIDRQVAQQWMDVRNMMIQLVIVTVVFICIIIGINIASKVHDVYIGYR